MVPSPMDWLGNRVYLQALEGTDLTVLQWCRPWNGVLRGVRVLGGDELRRMSVAITEAAEGGRDHPRLDSVAGRPLDLTSFLGQVLDDGRGPG